MLVECENMCRNKSVWHWLWMLPEHTCLHFSLAFLCMQWTILWLLQVIDPLRSRCLCIRVAAPTLPQIEQVLEHVADQAGVKVPERLRTNIAQVRRPAELSLAGPMLFDCLTIASGILQR